MEKAQLARGLRQRLAAAGLVEKPILALVSDDDVIDSYITCSCCGEEQVSPEELALAIAQAHDASHFLVLCDEKARANSRGHLQLPPPGLSPTRQPTRPRRKKRKR